MRGVRARAPVEGGTARALLRARGGPGSVLSGSAARAVRAARDGERPRGARGRPRGRPAAPRHQRRQRRLGGAGAADRPRLRGVSDGFRQRGGSFGRRARRGAAVIQPRLCRAGAAHPRRGAHGGDGSLLRWHAAVLSLRGRGRAAADALSEKGDPARAGPPARAGRGAGRARSDSPAHRRAAERALSDGGTDAGGRACAARAAAAPPGEPHPGAGLHARVAAFAARGERDGGLWLG